MLPSSERLLSSLLYLYSALVPVKNLPFPSSIPFNVAHDFFLRKILLNHHLKQYPPSESYQQSFWKWVLVQLENLSRGNADDEIDECIYAHYLSLRTSSRSGPPMDSFITHYWGFPKTHGHAMEADRYETITLLESRTTIEAGTTGLRTWRASLALAQYLTRHPYLVDTSNVLELGSGTGFIGILVASLQLCVATPFDRKVPSVYLTDANSAVLARCQNNVELPCNKSSSHPSIHYKPLDWLDSLSDQETFNSFFNESKLDIVLGADIVFDPMLILPLVKTVSLALSFGHVRLVLIALTMRNEETLAHFLGEIGKVLKIEEVAHDVSGNLLLQVPDQVDAELEVKIFKVTRAEDVQFPTNFEEMDLKIDLTPYPC